MTANTKSSAENVYEALTQLPDEKVSAARIAEEAPDDTDLAEGLHELILLGEVELCQKRGTGPRVWLKNRQTSDETEYDTMADSVWKGYVATNSEHRMADRLFATREGAIAHLEQSAVVARSEFMEVSYLADVWRADTTGFEGIEPMTAVVRREPVYRSMRPTSTEESGSTERSTESKSQISLADFDE